MNRPKRLLVSFFLNKIRYNFALFFLSLSKNNIFRMRRIFLIGYMGAGKTTLGKELAKQMNLSYIDLDHHIEQRYCQTVRKIFDEKGEDAFREIEKKVLEEVASFENIIISTGGGAPCFFDNMSLMKDTGLTVYLKATTDELIRRIELNKQARPVLQNRSAEELVSFIDEALKVRLPFYEQAHIHFDAEMMNTAEDIVALTEKLKQQIKNY